MLIGTPTHYHRVLKFSGQNERVHIQGFILILSILILHYNTGKKEIMLMIKFVNYILWEVYKNN